MDLDFKTKLENIFRIEINDAALFKAALTHTSYSAENDISENYERLEFLGDAVLKLCVSEILYKTYPEYSEGNLSKIRSIIVSDETLSTLVDKLGLQELIFLGKQEDKMGGRNKQSIKACAFEALLGAFFLNRKFKKIETFLKKNLKELIKEVDKNFDKYNSKEVLQEYTQGLTKTLPEYRVVKEEGPAHNKIFTVEVSYQGKILSNGVGKTKREAEKEAAYIALKKLKEES